jgi:hypothetical protein
MELQAWAGRGTTVELDKKLKRDIHVIIESPSAKRNPSTSSLITVGTTPAITGSLPVRSHVQRASPKNDARGRISLFAQRAGDYLDRQTHCACTLRRQTAPAIIITDLSGPGSFH